MNEKWNRLCRLLEEMEQIQHILSVLSFDSETICPEGGQAEDARDIVFLSDRLFSIVKGEEFRSLVKELSARKDGDEYSRRLLTLLSRDLRRNEKVSPELQSQWNQAQQDAFRLWAKAREKKDYALFAPALERILELSKTMVSLREDFDKEHPYQSLIDDYEPGFTQAELDDFFLYLREEVVPLLDKIRRSGYRPREDFLSRRVPLAKQEAFGRYLLELNGFDFRRGALTTTIHPFTSAIGKEDVRVTTHYDEHDFAANLYTIVHEGGHALFAQNLPDEVFASHLGEGSLTMAKHESVSRFYENLVGRSRAYIHLIYPAFRKIFAEEMSDVCEEELYEAVNAVHLDNPIRMEADELTYSLHILIRYQLEKDLMSGKAEVSSLNRRWNTLYQEILGVTIRDDLEGILQDVHWTSGFGYFPTYAMGNALGAMYFEKMQKDIDANQRISDGEMKDILNWMKQNVFARASLLDTKEWIERITGEKFSPKRYVDYLKKKFARLYRL